MNVLVTGSAGRLGRAAVKGLVQSGHHVVGLDVRATPGIPTSQSLVGSLLDHDLLNSAVKGIDCVIHLAATPDDRCFPPRPDVPDNFESDLLPNNLLAPYRLLEAARLAGVKRIVLASTGQVIDGYLRGDRVPVNSSVLPEPRYLYASTKVFLEALGQVYAKQHQLTVLAVRLGWCPRDEGQVAEIRASELAQDVFLSPGDAGRFFTATVEAVGLPAYSVVYASSKHTHRMRYDLSEARRLLNWEPREQWDTGATEGFASS